MAIKYAVASGNWSTGATWNGGTPPTDADDVYSNTFTVAIDQDVKVLSIRNTAGGAPPSAGGSFTFNTGYITKAGTITSSVVSIGVMTIYQDAGYTTPGNGMYVRLSSSTTDASANDYLRDISNGNYISQIDTVYNSTDFKVKTTLTAATWNTKTCMKFSKVISGTSTLFTDKLLPNNTIRTTGGVAIGIVSSISSDTSITLVENPFGSLSTAPTTFTSQSYQAPLMIKCTRTDFDIDGTNLITGAVVLLKPVASNTFLNIWGVFKSGSVAAAYAFDINNTSYSGATIFLRGGVYVGSTATAGIFNANTAGVGNTFYIDGIFKGGTASSGSATSLKLYQNTNIYAMYGANISILGGTGANDNYGILASTLSNIDLSNTSNVYIDGTLGYGIFLQNSANLTCSAYINSLSLGGAAINVSTFSGTIYISGGTIKNTSTAHWLLGGPASNSSSIKVYISDSVLITYYTSTASKIWNVGGATTSTAAEFWAYTTRTLTGSQTFNLTGNITGDVSGSVGSIAANGISASSIQSNAITADKIATDAIDADALAADAVQEISTKVISDLDSGSTTDIAKRLRNVSTVDTTGNQIASYNI